MTSASDPARAADRPTPRAEACASEEYRWSGVMDLAGSGATATTGVDVPAAVGTWLRVAGISADGLDASGFVHAVGVTVGTATAVVGGQVDAGVVGVRALDDVAVTVSGVTLVVDRCREVAAEAPIVPPAGAGGGADLPGTGRRSEVLLGIGALTLAAGIGLQAVARRRHC